MKGNERETDPKRVLGIVILSILIMAFVLWLGRGKSSQSEVFSESTRSESTELANSKMDSESSKSSRSVDLFPNQVRPPLTEEQIKRNLEWRETKAFWNSPRGDYRKKTRRIIKRAEERARDPFGKALELEMMEKYHPDLLLKKMSDEEKERDKFRELAWARYELEQFESKDAQGQALMDLKEFAGKTWTTDLTREWRDLETIHFDDGKENPRSFYEGDLKIGSALTDIISISDGFRNSIWESRLENDWQLVGDYLKARRDHSKRVLDSGNPPDPHWHAEHVLWIEETAETIGIPIDDLENENWIARQMDWLRGENDFTKPQSPEEKYKDDLRNRAENIHAGLLNLRPLDDINESLLRSDAEKLGLPPPAPAEEILDAFIQDYGQLQP